MSTASTLALLALLSAAPGPADAGQDRPPNVLLIVADDLGPEWIGCYGSEETAETGGSLTPRIDALAAESLRFQTCWATPVCTPSRMVLLTGSYPFRNGWVEHHDAPRDASRCFDWTEQRCLVRSFRDQGYATGLFGKWQLNNLVAQPDALKQHGFETHCVWPGVDGGVPPSQKRYWDAVIVENGERSLRDGEYAPDLFAAALAAFMEEHRERPFFAMYSMILPHRPNRRPPPYRERDISGARIFPYMVHYLDQLVGRVLDELDRLELRDRTLVVFSADNGSPRTHARAWGRRVHGGKNTLKETGLRVPLIVRAPGGPAGAVDDGLVDFSDLIPTCARLAGVPLPRQRRDAVPFVAAFDAESDAPRRTWIYSELDSSKVIRGRRYKLQADGKFVDLQEDPTESEPFRAEGPSAPEECRSLREELLKIQHLADRLEARRREGRDEGP